MRTATGRARAIAAVRSSDGGLLVLALLVGAGAGAGAIVFSWLIRVFAQALFGHGDYSAIGHAANPHLPGLGRWFVIFAPVAATFNAPLAAVFFAMELILRDFATNSVGMVVLASVTASVIGRAALGNHPFLTLPPFTVHHMAEYFLFAALGVMAGAVGVAFTRASGGSTLVGWLTHQRVLAMLRGGTVASELAATAAPG